MKKSSKQLIQDIRAKKTQVFKIGWPGGQSVTTPRGMFFNIWGGSQLPYIAKIEKYDFQESVFIDYFPIIPLWPILREFACELTSS